MPSLSDTSLAASRVRADQAQRLTRLRERLGLDVRRAAEMAGVSRFSWSRMERGMANLDAVALARFVSSAGLPAEYVVTGRLDGLPLALQRELVQVEAAERLGGAAGNVAAPPRAPRGRKRQTRTARTPSEATRAD